MLQIWEAAIYDSHLACATSIAEMNRDIDSLRRSVTSRGLGSFLLDLPLLDDTILSLLENGECRFSGHFHGRKSKRDRRPRFLWAFWSLVCDADGCLYEDPKPEAIVAIRQLACLFKKDLVVCSPDRLRKAIDEFHTIESEILPPVLDWASDSIDPSKAPTFSESFRNVTPSDRTDYRYNQFLRRLDRVAGILISAFPLFDSMSNNDQSGSGYFKHGPGVVSNQRYGSYKYDFASWSDKLEGVFPFDWCSGQSLGSFPSNRQESPGRLAAVPKTAKGPRLIASEPVEHQWCQQKIATWIDYHLRDTLSGKFIALHDQTLSQRMVAQASVDRSFCTIDLSSASDRISCRHMESLLRYNLPWLEASHAVRTRRIKDGVLTKKVYDLRKFSTMGSALTFPMQCLFFLSVTLASCGADSVKSIQALVGKVRVFGDDIIAPVEAYGSIVENLTLLGLKVNQKKSFHLGYFRESCGADYWRGFDITPVRPKTIGTDTPESTMATVDASNNFYKKLYWRTATAIMRLLPNIIQKRCFDIDSGVPGLVSYMGESIVPMKWCDQYHIYYSMILTNKTSIKRVVQDTSATLSEHFTRLYSKFNPRVLGIARTGKARLALSRVGMTPEKGGIPLILR